MPVLPVKAHVNRIDKHDLPKKRVVTKLRRVGLEVDPVSSSLGYDLLVNGEIRVALRVAFPGIRRHRVTVNKRNYQYRYRSWHFNFHHHGKIGDRYTDFFVCIAVHPRQPSQDEVFVIPWEKVTGKTFSLHGGKGTYSGRYAGCRDAWDQIPEAARQSRSLQRVA